MEGGLSRSGCEKASMQSSLEPIDLLSTNFKQKDLIEMSEIFGTKDINRAISFIKRYLDRLHQSSCTEDIDKAMYAIHNLSGMFEDEEAIESYLYNELWKKVSKNKNISVLTKGLIFTKFLYDRHHNGDYANLNVLYEDLNVLIEDLFAAINTPEGKYYIRVLASLLVNDALLNYFGKRMKDNSKSIQELIKIMNNCREGMEHCNKMIYTHLLLFLIKSNLGKDNIKDEIINTISNIIYAVKDMKGDEETNLYFDVICLEYAVIAHKVVVGDRFIDNDYIENLKKRVEDQKDMEIKIDFYMILGNYYKKIHQCKIDFDTKDELKSVFFMEDHPLMEEYISIKKDMILAEEHGVGKAKINNIKLRLQQIKKDLYATGKQDYESKAESCYDTSLSLIGSQPNLALCLGPNYKLMETCLMKGDKERMKRNFFEGWEIIKECFGDDYRASYRGKKYFSFWKENIAAKGMLNREIGVQIDKEFAKYMKPKFPDIGDDIYVLLQNRFPNIRFAIYDIKNSVTIAGVGFENYAKIYDEILEKSRRMRAGSMVLGGSTRQHLEYDFDYIQNGFFSMGLITRKFVSASKHYIVVMDNGPHTTKRFTEKELDWIENIITKMYDFKSKVAVVNGFTIV